MTADATGRRLRVAVLCGGRSGEHEVSLASARSVVANLDPAKYDVQVLGITKEGQWVLPAQPDRALTEGLGSSECLPARIRPDRDGNGLVRGPQDDAGTPVDVVFPVLHGPYGEDGTVQGLLELAGVPYVGAGVLGSAVAMDKVVMKTLFRAAGLPTPGFLGVFTREWRADPEAVTGRVASHLGFPCFVKPANLGSSVGISKAHSASELPAAMAAAAEYDLKLILERSVEDAHEIECGVLGNEEPVASVLGEVLPSREFYSYEAKYVDEASELLIPAPLPEAVAEQARALAVAAFQAVDCAGLGRVDFLITRGSHQVFVSEINTIPGFTQISMYPKLWEASGLSYSALLDRLIELALARHAERAALKTTYDGQP